MAEALHHITSHRGDGSRPQGPLYPRNNNCNTSENKLKIGDFAPTRSLWLKI